MIYLRTKLTVFDNSGVLLVRCIHVSEAIKRRARLGTFVMVSVKKKKYQLTHLSLKEKVIPGVVVASSWNTRRESGYHIKFDLNAVILITKQKTMIGHRVLGPLCKEIYKQSFIKDINFIKKTI